MTLNIKLMIAIWSAKFIIFLGSLFNRQTSSFPGKIASRIFPDILKYLADQIEFKIVVCGTNGKTTTNNLIKLALEGSGHRVVCNSKGANMIAGVVTAFVESANIFGKVMADVACLEIDEFWAHKIFVIVKPNIIVINNLFKDQLDRFGEIDKTIKALQNAVNVCPKATLILNADDPLVAFIGRKSSNNCLYFSVDNVVGTVVDKTSVGAIEESESRFCKNCGIELKYSYINYGQIGKYTCECGFSNPIADYVAKNINLSKDLNFDISDAEDKKLSNVNINTTGIYNVYNILACYCAINKYSGVNPKFAELISKYSPQIGRLEHFRIKNKEVILNLSKNPAGFNQILNVMNDDPNDKTLVLIINDGTQDGHDISWLWDVHFEKIVNNKLKNIVIMGTRALDTAVRIKYCDYNIEKLKIEVFSDKSISNIFNECEKKIYFLVNYTALFKTQKILKRLSLVVC